MSPRRDDSHDAGSVAVTPEELVSRVRAICLGFPEVTERPSHGTPTWFVRGKASFVTIWPNGHHEDELAHLWCAAPPGGQQELIAADPSRYHRPKYVGGRGWVGVRLDVPVDWAELREIIEEAYRTIAPPKLVAQLDDARP